MKYQNKYKKSFPNQTMFLVLQKDYFWEWKKKRLEVEDYFNKTVTDKSELQIKEEL